MAKAMAFRIRPGAPVECVDGHIGTVDGVERDVDGNPAYLRVTRGWSGESLLVPVDLIRAVDREGVAKLGATRDEVEDTSHQGPGAMHSIFDERTSRLDADDLERV